MLSLQGLSGESLNQSHMARGRQCQSVFLDVAKEFEFSSPPSHLQIISYEMQAIVSAYYIFTLTSRLDSVFCALDYERNPRRKHMVKSSRQHHVGRQDHDSIVKKCNNNALCQRL